jgi:predicted ATPase
MLTHLYLKSPSSQGQPKLNLPLAPSITIFVGPNNSGKSLLLRDIALACSAGASSALVVLEKIEFAPIDQAAAEAEFARIKRVPKLGESIHDQHSAVRIGDEGTQLHDPHYYLGRTDPNNHNNFYTQYYLKPLTLSLDGATRIRLLDGVERGDLKNPTRPLPKIYTDNPKREKWRRVVHEAFGLYPGVDALSQGHLSVRFGMTPPPSERTHEDDIIEWMRSARDLKDVSDGVKAFSGILLQLYAGDPKVIIIDESEAFLHPSLASTLAGELAAAALTEDKYVFVATHSAEFVMGAIQSGAIVNIVRLTYANGVATARLLPNDDLIALMNDPMLRSVGVLAGLFYDHVVVTEGDTDRAFYQEINTRLLAVRDARGIPHALFLNADNHQTVPSIVAPLRKLGVPAVGVVDLDVVKLGGKEWVRQLDACGFPVGQHATAQTHRKTIFDKLVSAAPEDTEKPEDYFKVNGGVDLLSHSDRETANNLFDQLDQYGLFIVRIGEVEAWLRDLGAPQKSGGWRAAIFKAMGSDPKKQSYAKPQAGDVWDFVGSLAKWLTNPSRRGIPP